MLLIACLCALALMVAWHVFPAFTTALTIFGRSDANCLTIANNQTGENKCVGGWGRALVVMCLRGNDPLLTDALRALLNQDYGDFSLRIIVDSEQDPAWHAIEASGVTQDQRVRLEVLNAPPPTCGLKNASLLQVLEDLEPDFKFLALTDADVVTYPGWLRELLSPLRDSAVGLTTGIRWYHPQRPSIPALMRSVWNAAATTQMVGFRIPWGGSLAMSLDLVTSESLRSLWRRGLCEDTMMTRHLIKFGYKQVFVPSIIMVNREDCRMKDLLRWIKRQLIVSRLYHPSWKWTVFHGLTSGLVPLAVFLCFLWQALCGDKGVALRLAAGLSVYLGITIFATIMGFLVMQFRLKTLGREAVWGSFNAWLRLPLVVSLLQVLYPVLLMQATFAKTVDWRGMNYRIQRDRSVLHDGHVPYVSDTNLTSLHSL